MPETLVLAAVPCGEKSFLPDTTFELDAHADAQVEWAKLQDPDPLVRAAARPYQLWVYLKVPASLPAGYLACFCDRSLDKGDTWITDHHFTLRTEDASRPLQPGGPAGVPGVIGPWDGQACRMKIVCATSVPMDIGVAYQLVAPK